MLPTRPSTPLCPPLLLNRCRGAHSCNVRVCATVGWAMCACTRSRTGRQSGPVLSPTGRHTMSDALPLGESATGTGREGAPRSAHARSGATGWPRQGERGELYVLELVTTGKKDFMLTLGPSRPDHERLPIYTPPHNTCSPPTGPLWCPRPLIRLFQGALSLSLL